MATPQGAARGVNRPKVHVGVKNSDAPHPGAPRVRHRPHPVGVLSPSATIFASGCSDKAIRGWYRSPPVSSCLCALAADCGGNAMPAFHNFVAVNAHSWSQAIAEQR